MQRMDNVDVTTPLTSTSQFIEAGESYTIQSTSSRLVLNCGILA